MAMDSYNSYKPTTKSDSFAPFRKYTFGTGDLGGEIRLSIPLSATHDDVKAAADMIATLAERWKGIGE